MGAADPDAPSPREPSGPAWKEFARAPLVPVGLAAGIGLVSDRAWSLPFSACVFCGLAALVAWALALARRSPAAPVWLWLAAAALAAGRHHAYREFFAPDDIGHFAPERPTPARVRGTLDEEPVHLHADTPNPLRTVPRPDTSVSILAVTAVETRDGWRPASGRARLRVDGLLTGLHLGDDVEVVARLVKPDIPSNPGEWDYCGHQLDQRLTADLHERGGSEGVTRLREGWRASLFGWFAVIRGWGTRTLQAALPPREAGIAAALLLGDGAVMDRAEWDVYVRTGVVHVLAISGQHLVILAWFVWVVVRVGGVRRRHGAWAVIGVMIGYTLLTGARPSAVRAAVMVCVVCGGIVLRRPVNAANGFALAWLLVMALNPTDPFTQGCQLSFVSVFVLVWGAGRWLQPRELTPIERLIEETRSPLSIILRSLARGLRIACLVSLILGIANAPLILSWQNIVSPVGVVLGPPLLLLTSVALIAGFLLLLVSPFGMWASWVFARITELSLAACDWLAHLAARIPGGWVYAPAPAAWWITGFYAALAGVVLLDGRWRIRFLAGLAMWVVFGLSLGPRRSTDDELRLTFLAVGDGGCVVIETPDGRVLLYDVGTMAGPDVTRRTIAPYLWTRGVTRIDEVFLSHADLDHFNGIPALLDRFPIGRITLTPTFREKQTAGVAAALAAIERHGVGVRVVQAGDRFAAGEVAFTVVHPPARLEPGSPLDRGNENTRSLVLLIEHAGHRILLTGDLEGAGQDEVRKHPLAPVSVMLAPHHGAFGANHALRGEQDEVLPGQMAAWARPRLVVSSQRAGRGAAHLRDVYGAVGAIVWDTATAGAVTVRSHASGVIAEAYRTGEVRVIHRGGP